MDEKKKLGRSAYKDRTRASVAILRLRYNIIWL